MVWNNWGALITLVSLPPWKGTLTFTRFYSNYHHFLCISSLRRPLWILIPDPKQEVMSWLGFFPRLVSQRDSHQQIPKPVQSNGGSERGEKHSSSDSREPSTCLTAAEPQHQGQSLHAKDISQDLGPILNQITLKAHPVLWPARQRRTDFIFYKSIFIYFREICDSVLRRQFFFCVRTSV